MTLPFHDRLPAGPVRVGRISYMNVAPVYWGLNNGGKPRWMDMVAAPPATLNAMLARDELDISPVSSAAYAAHHSQWLLLPDLSISCTGPVMSVLLVSRVPFSELNGKTVALTRESAAAAALTRLLFARNHIRPVFETGGIRRPEDVGETVAAGLVIGDAALSSRWRDDFGYVWDLGEMWWNETRSPFVFALWAVRKAFAEAHPEWVCAVVDRFQESRREGERCLDRIILEACGKIGITTEACRRYYGLLQYDLDPLKIEGLTQFFTGLYQEHILPYPVRPAFFEAPFPARFNGRAA